MTEAKIKPQTKSYSTYDYTMDNGVRLTIVPVSVVSTDEPVPYNIISYGPHNNRCHHDKAYYHRMTGVIDEKSKEIYNRMLIQTGCTNKYKHLIILPGCQFYCNGDKISLQEFLKKDSHTAKIQIKFSIVKYEDGTVILNAKILKIYIYSPMNVEESTQKKYLLEMIKPEYKTCCVCTETIENDPYMTTCFHLYHKKCIEVWFKTKRICPSCNKKQ